MVVLASMLIGVAAGAFGVVVRRRHPGFPARLGVMVPSVLALTCWAYWSGRYPQTFAPYTAIVTLADLVPSLRRRGRRA